MATSSVRLKNAILANLQTTLPPLVAAAGLPAIAEFHPFLPARWLDTMTPQVRIHYAGGERLMGHAQGAANAMYPRDRTVEVYVGYASPDPETADDEFLAYLDLLLEVMMGDQYLNHEALRVEYRATRTTYNRSASPNALFRVGCHVLSVPRWSGIGVD